MPAAQFPAARVTGVYQIRLHLRARWPRPSGSARRSGGLVRSARTQSNTGRRAELIDRAAHHPLLTEMIATTTAFDLAERIRAAETLRERYPTTGIDEHAAIVDAITNRDGARAEQLMRAHLTRTGEFFVALRSGADGHTGAEPRR